MLYINIVLHRLHSLLYSLGFTSSTLWPHVGTCCFKVTFLWEWGSWYLWNFEIVSYKFSDFIKFLVESFDSSGDVEFFISVQIWRQNHIMHHMFNGHNDTHTQNVYRLFTKKVERMTGYELRNFGSSISPDCWNLDSGLGPVWLLISGVFFKFAYLEEQFV